MRVDYMKKLMAFVVLALANLAKADTPLPPPKELTVCSPTKKLCATSDPTRNLTFLIPQSSGQKSWQIPGWHRWIFISDDGESVVIGYSGKNLVPLDVRMSESVLFFYNRGQLVRTVKLEELYSSKSQLRRTVSHYAWVNRIGFNGGNQFVVELVNGNDVAFAAATGEREAVLQRKE